MMPDLLLCITEEVAIANDAFAEIPQPVSVNFQNARISKYVEDAGAKQQVDTEDDADNDQVRQTKTLSRSLRDRLLLTLFTEFFIHIGFHFEAQGS